MVKNKELAVEKIRSKMVELEQQISNWKGKYESCYYSWEQSKEECDEYESKL